MKRWARVVVILVAFAATSIWLFLPNNKSRHAAERTRQSLRQDGFKIDLNQFDLPTPSGLGANNELLRLAADTSRNVFSFRRLDFMRPLSTNAAIVVSNQEDPDGNGDDYYWAELRKAVVERKALLDGICEALISAQFQFKMDFTTNGELAPDALRARLLGSAIAARTMLELHEQHRLQTWTNLLALTRLVTAWQTEPAESSHFIRFRWVSTAERVTWEALQAKEWTDDQLGLLQHEWESPNFFSALPETAAFSRANTVRFCSFQRRQPPPRGLTLREFMSELINSPNRAWSDATSGWRNARYRNYESYEDEVAWLLFYRDCELDYRRALLANTWSELRAMASATNSRPAQASNSALSMDSFRMAPGGGGFQRQGPTLLARAADAEARRRLVVTAIAIERFRLTNHYYPESLEKLVPQFLQFIPKDFMDGESLRYHRTDDGRFVLYSVGLDCIDDHGQLLPANTQNPTGSGFGRLEGPDIVWPLPASPTEVRAFAQDLPTQRAPESRRRSGLAQPGRSIVPGFQERTNALRIPTASTVIPRS